MERCTLPDGERRLTLYSDGAWVYSPAPKSDLFVAWPHKYAMDHEDDVLRVSGLWTRWDGQDAWDAQRTVEFPLEAEWAWMIRAATPRPCAPQPCAQ